MAAVLACGPRAVVSHFSAAAASGLRPSSRRKIEITTPDRGRRGPPDVEVHCVRRLSPHDVTSLRGIPITTVARTLVDLAGVLPADQLQQVVHEAEVQRCLDVAAVEAAIERANGRRGIAALLAALCQPSPGATHSELERHFVALCRRGGLTLPRLNVPLQLGERLVEVDGLWVGQRVIVELDGEESHHTRRAFHADRRRDSALAALGYVVVRLTWTRVTREPAATVSELRRLLAVRGQHGP